MNILAIETCTTVGSVAVVQMKDLRVLSLNEWKRGKSHAEVATPALADAVAIAGGWPQIGAIAVDVGPGSFTGIRVGLNSARAAAWDLRLPVIGFTSTSILLEGVRESGLIDLKICLIGAVLNAQMGLVFGCCPGEQPAAYSPVDFVKHLEAQMKLTGRSQLVLVGDGLSLLEGDLMAAGLKPKMLDTSLDVPHAATLGRMAASILVSETDLQDRESLVSKYSWQHVQPLYIRGSGAEEKRR